VTLLAELLMPGARPNSDDNYLCHGFEVEKVTGSDPVYVTAFEPVDAEAIKAHHMLLYACDRPSGNEIYDCRHHTVCGRGRPSILFAWAKNADAKTMPEGVSFELNPKEKKYLILQVHYAHALTKPDHTGLRLKYQKNK